MKRPAQRARISATEGERRLIWITKIPPWRLPPAGTHGVGLMVPPAEFWTPIRGELG